MSHISSSSWMACPRKFCPGMCEWTLYMETTPTMDKTQPISVSHT